MRPGGGAPSRTPLPIVSPPRFDLLRTPVVGRYLRWRHARSVAQAILLLLAVLLVVDGLGGPQLPHRNWAGVLPWIHWRGLVVVALLAAGNFFCFACPFMLPRRLGKWLLPGGRSWPRALRTRWAAAALLVLFFWGYEAFDLWASPLWTAWLILGYFGAAFVVDGFFRGAAFCKHLCPIGQFNFVHSTLSPLEVAVRDPTACAACTTRDCIVGRRGPPEGPATNGFSRRAATHRGPLLQSGCELWLYQPAKVGNLDCTFCLDCVQACPHDNVGILGREPARELWEDPRRSGIGRLSDRPDMAALVLVLVFAAFVNTFGMIAPVHRALAALQGITGTDSPALATVLLFGAGLVLAPLLLAGVAAWAGRALSGESGSLIQVATRYAWSLVPVGFGMWAAHYLFHFLLGALTIIPVAQLYLQDLGLPSGGPPLWSLGPILPPEWVLPLQLLLFEAGFLVSLVVAWRIGRRLHGPGRTALRAALPWMVLAALLSGVGIWLLFQPMEMRGTFLGA